MKSPRGNPALVVALLAFALAALSAAAIWYCGSRGYLLWYGDAEAHLNNARRIFDSATPGYDQLGTPWLPVPHLAMAPLAAVDGWWRSGFAAAPAAALSWVAGVLFLFAAVRRIFDSTAAALSAAALVALNPNLLYLQSTAMTEAFFFAELAALLYFTVSGRVLPAALATIAATLTRYEGWFLIPFVALWFGLRRPRLGILYTAVASLGPLYWLFHNWYLTGDALAFYRGPYSARAIQGGQPYPGLGNAGKTWLYYRTAVGLCTGPALPLMAIAGAAVAAWKGMARRAAWPLVLLALPPAFYLWSMYSSGGTPIFVPGLWPHSWYNTRYGLAALPLLAFAAAALVMAAPPRWRALAAVLVIVAGTVYWAAHHRPEDVVTWAESRTNSSGRRAWMYEAADFLRARYRPGQEIVSSGGDDLFGIYRAAGVPLRETFSVDNGLPWDVAMRRPQMLWQDWAVVRAGDELDSALARAAESGIRYELLKTIAEKDEPAIEIYRRR
jgi:hypothetical protein